MGTLVVTRYGVGRFENSERACTGCRVVFGYCYCAARQREHHSLELTIYGLDEPICQHSHRLPCLLTRGACSLPKSGMPLCVLLADQPDVARPCIFITTMQVLNAVPQLNAAAYLACHQTHYEPCCYCILMNFPLERTAQVLCST
jgi:hypothetical protein